MRWADNHAWSAGMHFKDKQGPPQGNIFVSAYAN
jgi:hypothetical protein